jgi:V8-like Glu-specific endopeptidase
MAAKNSRSKGKGKASSGPPMSLDEVSRLANIPDRADPPGELRNAATFQTLTFNEGGQDRVPDLSLRPVKGQGSGSPAGYHIISPKEFTFGLNVREMTPAQLPSKGSRVVDEFDSFTPAWSGVEYMPRLSSPPTRHRLRRRQGTPVIPEYVFPPEDRWVYYPSGYPWRCIGRLFVWQIASAPNWSWSGSAALIWKTAIVTCSHVVPWGFDGLWKALFVPAYYNGSSVYGSGGASWVTSAHGYADHDQGDDMAVMRLASSLGDWLGYFGYKTYNDDWEDGPYWTLAGYPGMIAGAERPSIQTGFPITDDDSDGAGVELEYKADSSDGNSGGPVFGWWDGKPYVIGTHSGGEDNFGEDKQNVAAGGSALSSLIKWARDHW